MASFQRTGPPLWCIRKRITPFFRSMMIESAYFSLYSSNFGLVTNLIGLIFAPLLFQCLLSAASHRDRDGCGPGRTRWPGSPLGPRVRRTLHTLFAFSTFGEPG